MAFSTPKGSAFSVCQLQLSGSITLSGAAATALTFTVPTGFRAYVDIQNALANVTTEIAGDQTAPTITIKTGSTSIGTITLADATAAGACTAATAATGKESGQIVAAAATIVIAHTQAADSGSAAGVATYYVPVYLERI